MERFDEERERFAEHYARLTDDELRKIAMDPWALSEAAWEALEDESDRRHLELPRPEAGPRLIPLKSGIWFSCARFATSPRHCSPKVSWIPPAFRAFSWMTIRFVWTGYGRMRSVE